MNQIFKDGVPYGGTPIAQTFESEEVLTPDYTPEITDNYADFPILESGAPSHTLWSKVAKLFKNVRWLNGKAEEIDEKLEGSEDFLRQPNFYDTSYIEGSGYLNSDGTVGSDANWKYAYIPVHGGKTYECIHAGSIWDSAKCVWLDSTKSVISLAFDRGVASPSIITAPSNAEYLGVSLYTDANTFEIREYVKSNVELTEIVSQLEGGGGFFKVTQPMTSEIELVGKTATLKLSYNGISAPTEYEKQTVLKAEGNTAIVNSIGDYSVVVDNEVVGQFSVKNFADSLPSILLSTIKELVLYNKGVFYDGAAWGLSGFSTSVTVGASTYAVKPGTVNANNMDCYSTASYQWVALISPNAIDISKFSKVELTVSNAVSYFNLVIANSKTLQNADFIIQPVTDTTKTVYEITIPANRKSLPAYIGIAAPDYNRRIICTKIRLIK